MLRVERLTKHFGELQAVRDLSFSVDKGELFGLVGPNGAGKTTTIKMIIGMLNPTDGAVHVNGFSVHPPTQERVSFRFRVPLSMHFSLDKVGAEC